MVTTSMGLVVVEGSKHEVVQGFDLLDALRRRAERVLVRAKCLLMSRPPRYAVAQGLGVERFRRPIGASSGSAARMPVAEVGSGGNLKQHERRRSPLRPVPSLACGPDEAPQPAHRASRVGGAIISRAGRRPQSEPCAAIFRQSRQRWNWARLSAPISQMKRRFGIAAEQSARACRPCSGCRARARSRWPGSAAPRAAAGAEAKRAASGAMPSAGFSGLPGETSHQISSSPSAAIAAAADPAVPAMGRVEGAAEKAGAGHAARDSMAAARSRTGLDAAAALAS